MSESPFTKPQMACRDCGKPAEGHGRYCNPVLDRLLLTLVAVAALLLLVVELMMVVR